MYLSYFQHPELQLLDEERCEDYVMSDKCQLLDMLRDFSKETIQDVSDNSDTTKGDLIDGLEQMLADGIIAENVKKTYMPSEKFDEAMEKSRKAFEGLMSQTSVLMDVHEDCCFISGVKRMMKHFIWKSDEEHGRQRYWMIEVVNGYITLWAGYSMSADDNNIEIDFFFRPNEDEWMKKMWTEYFGGDYTEWDLLMRRIWKIYGYLVFKRYSDVEMEEVVREKTLKKSTILRDKVNNFMGINVTLLDSRWFTTICRNEGFAVSGHFRLQPYKDGSRKLIYIAPFMKTGYHRQARIENEKE